MVTDRLIYLWIRLLRFVISREFKRHIIVVQLYFQFAFQVSKSTILHIVTSFVCIRCHLLRLVYIDIFT